MVKFMILSKALKKTTTQTFFVAGAAGIVSGLIKVPEGVFSLAAELFDLGADTDVAARCRRIF